MTTIGVSVSGWMFFSVTGSPGLSWIKSRERKMVLGVCVCACMRMCMRACVCE